MRVGRHPCARQIMERERDRFFSRHFSIRIWRSYPKELEYFARGVCQDGRGAVACVSIGGEMIFCSGKDKSLGIYNSFSGSQRERLLGHGDVVRAIRARLIQDRVVIASR